MTNEPEKSRVVDGVTIVAADNEWAMGVFGPCLIVVWRGTVSEDRTRQINDQLGELTQRLPGGFAYINLIEPNSPPPSSAVRKLAMAGQERPGKTLKCLAVAIEGHEIRSALVRAILTSMSLLRPHKQPRKFFKNAEQLAVWVKENLATAGIQIDDKEIVRAGEVTRSQMTK